MNKPPPSADQREAALWGCIGIFFLIACVIAVLGAFIALSWLR